MSAISSLSSVIKAAFGSDPVKASLMPIDEDGSPVSPVSQVRNRTLNAMGLSFEFYFQYFPETISSSKGANWVSKSIPGGSHPLYQFVGCSDHVISFPAVFTADERPLSGQSLLDLVSGGISLSKVASGLGIGAPKKHNTDVAAAVAWLRSYLLPSYDNGSSGMKPPGTLRLFLPNSGINGLVSNAVTGKSIITPDSIDVLMTQCDVVYESFHRSGHPRVAVVQLSFFETIQVGKNWGFLDRRDWIEQTDYANQYDRKGNNVVASIKSAKDKAGAFGGFI